MPQSPRDTSTIDRELFDLLGSLVNRPPPKRFSMGEGNPEVLEPPQQVPDYLPVQGSEMLQRLVQEYQKRLPWLGQYVSGVSQSPTPAAASLAESSGIPWQQVGGTNLLGATDVDSGEVYMNPTSGHPEMMEGVLAHEFAHGLGEPHSRRLYNIQGLGQMRHDALNPPQSRQSIVEEILRQLPNFRRGRP